jgi:prepilin peptidase CpaA
MRQDVQLFDLIPAAIASVAAIWDVRWRRIPNWLTLSAFFGGLVVEVLRYGVEGVPLALGGAALGLGVLLPFYAMHAMGAGDVKLLAGVGALVGPQALVSVAIYAALVGGAISVIMLARRGRLQFSMAEIKTRPTNLTRSGAKAPFGVAIACGVYLSMLLPSVIG